MGDRDLAEDRAGAGRAEAAPSASAGQAIVNRLQPAADQTEPAWPTLQTFALVRVLVSTALLLAVMMFGAPVISRALGADPSRMMSVLGAYFALSVSLLAWTMLRRSRFGLQIWAHLAVDLLLISLLVVLGGGTRSGVFIFYLLPLAEASLALPSVGAFFVCSLADLVLLGNEVLHELGGQPGEAQLFQAGVAGAALFGITALLRLLSTRLSRQEQLARRRGRELDSQLQINRLVISQMQQGVIVADATTLVRANNRSARLMLGFDPDAQLTGRRLLELESAQELAHAYMNWLTSLELGATPLRSDILIKSGEVGPAGAHRRLRVRFARPAFQPSDEFVIFMEDLQSIEERAQRLKLAAMGRLTASIAHEIRNPLAAISQAGQLLAEDVRDPLHQRLTSIVRENTQRLNRLVEDVLRAARRDSPLTDEFDLGGFCSAWLSEFVRDRGLAGEMIRLAAQSGVIVHFEQNQLRQVLFNLVDNALRYCSGRAGSIEIRVDASDGPPAPVHLWVFDDGTGVGPADRDSMFEPFFTTHSRGTGLGLYLAREFCMANGYDLTYAAFEQPSAPARFGFCLRFGPPEAPRAEQSDFMDTLPAT
ncbi:MAG TPA: HAMP domain-containing sensor histidine kinase [Burkholderiaceae bacterium]|nr:HAMP domain-containing sensor histidine kinase [Burkholderiaceae bacterium]